MKQINLKFMIYAGVLFFLIPLASLTASEIDDETCLDCHDGLETTLKFSAHRLSSTTEKSSTDIKCISCHNGADQHVEEPSADNISNPSRLDYNEASNSCFACHKPHQELDNYGFDAHRTNGINCSSCHTIHSSQTPDNWDKSCYKCHQEVKTSFMLNSNHPLNQDALSCLSCHNFVKKTDDNVAYGLNQACVDCHPSQTGPFLYEHEATQFYSLEDGSCINCHQPHGSVNNHLLKQPVNNLCSSCHFEPAHLTAHPDKNYDKMSCSSCHTSLHGSFDNKKLLDPDLPSKLGRNCYQSGCHSLNNLGGAR